MLTRLQSIPEGGISFFNVPPGSEFVYVYDPEDWGGWQQIDVQRISFTAPLAFVSAYELGIHERYVHAIRRFLSDAIRCIRDPDDGLLTIVFRGPYEMGLIWSNVRVQPRIRYKHEDYHPIWWEVFAGRMLV